MMNPTHKLADGTRVFPEGYDPADLTELTQADYDADAVSALADLERSLHNRIDDQAGQFRERFITSIAGQETTYRLKEDEARSWTSGADSANFPYLSEEATRRGVPIDDVAALVIQLADQWRALNPKIEGTRVATKDAVTAAQTATEKEAAAVVDWEALLTQ